MDLLNINTYEAMSSIIDEDDIASYSDLSDISDEEKKECDVTDDLFITERLHMHTLDKQVQGLSLDEIPYSRDISLMNVAVIDRSAASTNKPSAKRLVIIKNSNRLMRATDVKTEHNTNDSGGTSNNSRRRGRNELVLVSDKSSTTIDGSKKLFEVSIGATATTSTPRERRRRNERNHLIDNSNSNSHTISYHDINGTASVDYLLNEYDVHVTSEFYSNNNNNSVNHNSKSSRRNRKQQQQQQQVQQKLLQMNSVKVMAKSPVVPVDLPSNSLVISSDISSGLEGSHVFALRADAPVFQPSLWTTNTIPTNTKNSYANSGSKGSNSRKKKNVKRVNNNTLNENND